MRKALVLLAVFLVAALGTARLASAYDLGRDEQLGGHTLSRHVGRSDADLRQRLAREREVSAASTYDDRATAERIVGETLARYARRVDDWKARRGRRPNLALRFRGDGRTIGRCLERGRAVPSSCFDAVVVLRWDERLHDCYVLTSYPESRR
jgi:hypothetical protein